ncbi:proteasome accessory factor C [Haloactinopolyspora alba]|uniref:Proteasome accessory factor C n=1 Tax=Haloactinopolyspora alba TaxID=648780 RepID=A0A2P8EG50_9ACTN|nr:WYL domain-containing protein [Haloactinopolyspora alba]PSL08430.1 proteasome accessory factor C [Haloactinopolyspora alba]
MTGTPRYVQRFDRVTRALNQLALHAGGLPVAQLAEQVDVDAETLRNELRAYYRADVDPAFAPSVLGQTSKLRFHDADGEDVEPALAEFVSAQPRPTEDVGADYVTVGELANIYRAGQSLLAVEPDNDALDGALKALTATVLSGIGGGRSVWLAELAQTVGDALRRGRRIRVTYARTWRPGLREHVLEPYRLIKTRRGWELDAGIADTDHVGTFLLSGVRDAEVLDETFERPDDYEARIAANRHERVVDLVVPQDVRWAVERFAESVEVVHEDTESIRMRAYLLEPVEQRLGLLLVVAGPEAFVYDPPGLRDAGIDLARDLLAHHQDTPGTNRHRSVR